jgi:hypothetical protein
MSAMMYDGMTITRGERGDSIVFRGVDGPCLHSDGARLGVLKRNTFNRGDRMLLVRIQCEEGGRETHASSVCA